MGGMTTGTRKPGWGGSAKGAGNHGRGPGRPKGVPDGQGKTHRSVAALMAEDGGREEAAARWMAILRDPAHPRHADMVAKAAERMDGAAVQRVELLDIDPDTMTDAELAAIAARGSREAVNPADDPD